MKAQRVVKTRNSNHDSASGTIARSRDPFGIYAVPAVPNSAARSVPPAGIRLSLRHHFIVCAAGLIGLSTGFTMSQGDYLFAYAGGLFAAGVARSAIESRIFNAPDYERPTLFNLRSYMAMAPRTKLKKYNDAAVVSLTTVAMSGAAGFAGIVLGAQAGLLTLPFAAAAGFGTGALAGYISGLGLRYVPLGALSMAHAVAATYDHLVRERPTPVHKRLRPPDSRII